MRNQTKQVADKTSVTTTRCLTAHNKDKRSQDVYKRQHKKRQLSVAEFVEGIVKGDVTILSQAVTLVEDVYKRQGSMRRIQSLMQRIRQSSASELRRKMLM